MSGAQAFRERWTFTMVCRGCGAQFEFEEPGIGLEVMPGFWRLVLLRVPEVCRECKSLQVVGQAPPAPLDPPPEAPRSA